MQIKPEILSYSSKHREDKIKTKVRTRQREMGKAQCKCGVGDREQLFIDTNKKDGSHFYCKY